MSDQVVAITSELGLSGSIAFYRLPRVTHLNSKDNLSPSIGIYCLQANPLDGKSDGKNFFVILFKCPDPGRSRDQHHWHFPYGESAAVRGTSRIFAILVSTSVRILNSTRRERATSSFPDASTTSLEEDSPFAVTRRRSQSTSPRTCGSIST